MSYLNRFLQLKKKKSELIPLNPVRSSRRGKVAESNVGEGPSKNDTCAKCECHFMFHNGSSDPTVRTECGCIYHKDCYKRRMRECNCNENKEPEKSLEEQVESKTDPKQPVNQWSTEHICESCNKPVRDGINYSLNLKCGHFYHMNCFLKIKPCKCIKCGLVVDDPYDSRLIWMMNEIVKDHSESKTHVNDNCDWCGRDTSEYKLKTVLSDNRIYHDQCLIAVLSRKAYFSGEREEMTIDCYECSKNIPVNGSHGCSYYQVQKNFNCVRFF